ncbi:DUF262 domain-containing protein [Rubellimicrobium mesophilum]|uniref:DUF262 domain-containing protein n=1 Tax=Rubellimicrobium mesophilum TaxID=1123067 RepID=UPI000684AE65|nr:DUF262 domain-containing protein [Rubellimicrobium mesophilum]
MSYSATTIHKALSSINTDWFLPSIQRPYVWEPDQVVRLFDSLLKGFPISSFLLWEVDPEKVDSWQTYRFIENFKSGDVHNQPVALNGRRVKLVLDGQQRLTSLLIGLAGSYTVRAKHGRKNNPDAWSRQFLYIDLMKSPEERDEDELDSDIGVSYGLKFSEHDPRKSTENVWFPLARIMQCEDEAAFDRVHKDVLDKLPAGITRGERRTVENNLERLRSLVFHDEIISCYVEKDQSLDRVLNIFIRANDAGTKLSKSDLLMSMVTSKWSSRNARQDIYDFVDFLNEKLSRPNKLTKDFVLKAALVLTDLEVAYKVDNFTNENLALMEAEWRRIKESLVATLNIVNRMGIDRETLTSTNALMPIAYYVHKSGRSFDGSTPAEVLARWAMHKFLIGALVNGAFSGTSDLAISTCRGTIRDALRLSTDFPLAQLVTALGRSNRMATFTPDTLGRVLDIKYGDRRCFLALSLIYEDQVWGADYHIDHIIPQASTDRKALMKMGLPNHRIEEIFSFAGTLGNLQILLARENIEKSNRPFWDWIESRDSNFLDRHCIPSDKSLWTVEALPEFVQARERLLAAKILKVSPAAAGDFADAS